jgi:hypothetical protein
MPPDVPTTHSAQAWHFFASFAIDEQQYGQDRSSGAGTSLDERATVDSMRRRSGRG